MDGVHILKGPDYVKHFLLEKNIVEEECAWKTTSGWALSGPTRQDRKQISDKSKTTSVFFIQADIHHLWELEEMPGQHQFDLSQFFRFPNTKRRTGLMKSVFVKRKRPPS